MLSRSNVLGGQDLSRVLDAAVAFTIVDGGADLNVHVAFFTPGSAPGVSHDPVLGAAALSPTDDVGGVVLLATAVCVVEDTTRVGLEAVLVGLDGNGEDTALKLRLHHVDVT